MSEPAVAPAPSSSSASSAASAHAEQGRQERGKLVARAGVVGAGTLVSRILGLGRDMALAAIFDVDADRRLVRSPSRSRTPCARCSAEGAVSSAVVPVLSEKLAKDGDEAARRFFSRVRGASLVALVVVTVLGVLLARPLTALFAEGYKLRPGEFERTVDLTRAVFPYIFFMGTAALGMAALNANRRFAVAAFAPALLNVALLGAAAAAVADARPGAVAGATGRSRGACSRWSRSGRPCGASATADGPPSPSTPTSAACSRASRR